MMEKYGVFEEGQPITDEQIREIKKLATEYELKSYEMPKTAVDAEDFIKEILNGVG